MYTAIGRAMTTWQDVELQLFLLYARLITPRGNFHSLAAAFYTVKNFSTRADMVTNTVLINFGSKSPFYKAWQKLRTPELTECNGLRNRIAHFRLSNSGRGLFLVDEIINIAGIDFDSRIDFHLKRETKHLSVEDVEALTPRFANLAVGLSQTAVDPYGH